MKFLALALTTLSLLLTASPARAYLATDATGETILYWAHDGILSRGHCLDGDYVMSACQTGVQTVPFDRFLALFAPVALNYELVSIRLEDLVAFMVVSGSGLFPELEPDAARLDGLFQAALANP